MAWGIRGSKDPNENDEKNNNFDENYKNNCWLQWHEAWEGRKTPTKKTKTTLLTKILLQKLLSAMA